MPRLWSIQLAAQAPLYIEIRVGEIRVGEIRVGEIRVGEIRVGPN